MFDLAQWHGGAGPGPWILLFPLIWTTVIAGAVVLLRRAVRRGRRGPWHGGGPAAAAAAHRENAPVDLLGRRFASGEIDEDEYWRRLSVLQEGGRP
ncbi:SHOCT domain-containing protein [Streptomyces ovatisporus]|uniref:SHOCT domain-containing protein n=1 Tax=Streptomyces ovatisporus TaxID=1128682 RepID=A0ABV9AGJ9_9ACTN